MTREELLQMISDIHQFQSELDDVEVKLAHGGTPKRLYESLSAFSNQPAGGVILLGLDEKQKFEIIGIHDAHRLQEDISHLATSDMEPPVRPEFTVEEIDGKIVMAVEIFEILHEQKPCFYKNAGLQKGSYIRIGNTNRIMNDYEIFGYISTRTQATYDEEPVSDATPEDLDRASLDDYIKKLRKIRPHARYLNQPFEQILLQLKILRKVNKNLYPTIAGLLMFGNYPQSFEPQLVITFLQYYGTTETETTPRGERFLDNRKFEGTIPEMVESTVNHIMASIRKSSLIEGLWRRDIPEYPEEAVREAIV
ncbi:MAG: RNA-binding domain-containing protein, partial [Candidatus Eremiobacterota bacterium]